MHNAAPFYQGHVPRTRWKTNCVYNITTIATDTTRSTICYSSSSINLASSFRVVWYFAQSVFVVSKWIKLGDFHSVY